MGVAAVQMQPRGDLPAPGLARAGLDVAAVGADAFAHAEQAAADAGGRRGGAPLRHRRCRPQFAGQEAAAAPTRGRPARRA